MRITFLPLSVAAGTVLVAGLAAQPRVAIANGVLRGAVVDSIRQVGLGYALVTAIGANRRAFANGGGDFTIGGLKPGPERLRVQQIGYVPTELEVVLIDAARDSTAVQRLVIAAGPRVLILPELTVTAGRVLDYRAPKRCVAPSPTAVGPFADAVVDQAITNADRIYALEREYPVLISYQHIREAYDSTNELLARLVDTTKIRSGRRPEYRRGSVLSRDWLGRVQEAVYFTVVDLARKEFQKAHCLWYAGTDSTEEGWVHRIDFEPEPGVRSVDWEGRLLFDRETFQLVRSEAWLVRIDRDETIRSAVCAVRYGGDVATIVHELLALCVSEHAGGRAAGSRDIYRMIETRWLKRRPGEPR